MLRNRSVPVDTVLPHVVYKDLPEAIEWLSKMLGFVEHYRYGDPLSGAQVHLGRAFIMLKQARGDYRNPAELGFGTQSLTVFVEDIEQHFARAKAAGAISSRISTKPSMGNFNTRSSTPKAITGSFRVMLAT